jgi:hypothetical protein
MSLLRNAFLPIALGLFLAPIALAGDDDKKSDAKKDGAMTIRGVVSEVTLLGETDIDYKTRKATTAEATFLTIIGHPYNEAMHRQREKEREGIQASSDKNKEKDSDVKRTANNDSSRSAGRPRHRMNVYVLAVTPKTKFCECAEPGKEGSAAKEEACELDKLEIGDHVEVCFDPKMLKAEGDNANAKDDAEAEMKHGRHRTDFGTASAVKIMEAPMGADHSASQEKSDRSEKSEKK